MGKVEKQFLMFFCEKWPANVKKQQIGHFSRIAYAA